MAKTQIGVGLVCEALDSVTCSINQTKPATRMDSLLFLMTHTHPPIPISGRLYVLLTYPCTVSSSHHPTSQESPGLYFLLSSGLFTQQAL